ALPCWQSELPAKELLLGPEAKFSALHGGGPLRSHSEPRRQPPAPQSCEIRLLCCKRSRQARADPETTAIPVQKRRARERPPGGARCTVPRLRPSLDAPSAAIFALLKTVRSSETHLERAAPFLP